MAESFFSPSWYRVARLRPRLRGHARIDRQFFRGELWYVMHNHATGSFYRFSPVLYEVVGRMDGRRTVQELWEKAADRFGDDAATQGDVIRLLGQLHASDVLLCDLPPDTEDLFRRRKKIERSRRWINLRNPMSIRFGLLDPERFLAKSIPLFRPLFGPLGAMMWLALVASGLVLAGLHWSELTEDVMDRVLSADNLLLMWLVFPLLKAFHEFGHAYAVKAWGGEVHEMGIMLLVLMPVPYVDASAASAFRERRRRLLVGAAGMIVELAIASMALLVWANVAPGATRSIAYNVIFIASVSTVLFNANPLLRYDGYYMLSDFIEAPNLGQRSTQYLAFLFKHHLFGIKEIEPPYIGPGERFWLFTYSTASFVYRLFLYAGIILFISGKFFVIGILLGIWACVSMVILPSGKAAGFVLFSPQLRTKRTRAVSVSGCIVLLALSALFLLPFPLRTCTEGVIWAPEESLVRAGAQGFVERIIAAPDSRVVKGSPLIECEDPLLAADVRVLEAQLRELEARRTAEMLRDPVSISIIQEEANHVRSGLARANERLQELDIQSPLDGRLVIPGAADLPGRFVRQGELLGYVLNESPPAIRAVVLQADVDLVRKSTRSVEVRLASSIERIRNAELKREVPGGLHRLPSNVLATAGGGRIATDPRDPEGLKTFENVFQFDVELAEKVEGVNVGERVYLRFDHGLEPLAYRWYRAIRRLLLRQFNV